MLEPEIGLRYRWLEMVGLFEMVADLSLAEARGLRGGTVSAIRRLVESPPVEFRKGSWVRDGLVSMTLDEAKADAVERSVWRSGDSIFMREPWRWVEIGSRRYVQYRADGSLSMRAGNGSRVASTATHATTGDDWATTSAMPDWSWRMKAIVGRVQVSVTPIDPVGSLWSLCYEVSVKNV